MVRGKGKGKRKIEMAKIEDENHRFVTFSRRRIGLFKCADQLSVLTGANLGVIVFSPTRKAFSFGCPDIQSVIDTFKTQTPPPPHVHFSTTDHQVAAAAHDLQVNLQLQRHENLEFLNSDFSLLEKTLYLEKRHGEFQEYRMNVTEDLEHNWWEKPADEMSLDELDKLKVAMEDLKIRVLNEYTDSLKEEIMLPNNPNEIGSGATTSEIPPDNFVLSGCDTGGVGSSGGGGVNHMPPSADIGSSDYHVHLMV